MLDREALAKLVSSLDGIRDEDLTPEDRRDLEELSGNLLALMYLAQPPEKPDPSTTS